MNGNFVGRLILFSRNDPIKNSDFRNVRKVKDNQLIATILHKINMTLKKYRSSKTSSGKRFPEKILLIDTEL